MKKISAIITGSTGMVGKGVLLECLENDIVESVLIVNRRSLGLNHPKLNEIIHENLNDISGIENQFIKYNACFFCMGVSSIGMTDKDYTHITYDLTLNFSKTVHKVNPDIHFCYVSGTGTDSSETGRQMWARVKGKTENDLLALFKSATMFRPGFIQPSRGEKAKSSIVTGSYSLLKPFFPILKKLFPKHVTSTEAVGKAMINSAQGLSKKLHLESHEINELANYRVG